MILKDLEFLKILKDFYWFRIMLILQFFRKHFFLKKSPLRENAHTAKYVLTFFWKKGPCGKIHTRQKKFYYFYIFSGKGISMSYEFSHLRTKYFIGKNTYFPYTFSHTHFFSYTFFSYTFFLLEHNGVLLQHNGVLLQHNEVLLQHNEVFSEHNRVFSEHNRAKTRGKSRISHELGPGESKSALDQDVEIYIGWLFGFKHQKYARIAKIVEKRTYRFLLKL